jgi:hypothetical protein
MSSSQPQRFFRIERGVYSTENHPGSALPDYSADLITAKSISCVDTDADHIARLDMCWIKPFQGLIADLGISERLRGSSREDIQPARSDDCCPEGHVTRINEMNGH